MLSDSPPNNPQGPRDVAGGGSTFVLSRDTFDAIPGYRARYIILYILITLLLIAPKAVLIVTKVDPPYEFALLYYGVLLGLCLPFYFYLFKTMHTLGYPMLWSLLTILVVSTPILGIFPMGFMDRKIADTWDKADGEHQRYRQRVSEDEEGERE